MAQRQTAVAVRWTIGDVRERGFEALRLSLWGAHRVFGEGAAYAVCVNTLSVEEACERTGPVPPGVSWRVVDSDDVPSLVRDRLNRGMAEGVAWKFAPLRLYPDRFEISLDNDCILWDLPMVVGAWLGAERERCVIGSDVRVALGQFERLGGGVAGNSGIRGLPPAFDYEAALAETIERLDRETGTRTVLRSELDEQGWQVAAVSAERPALVVGTDEVAICSPFHPHSPCWGRCGAHFVGLNARRLPWEYYDRPADAWMAEFWERQRGALRERGGIARSDARARSARVRAAEAHQIGGQGAGGRPSPQHRVHHASADHRHG